MSNDVFNGTSGNDTFNGGNGTDTVTFAGNAAGYRIDLVGGLIRVVDIDASNGDTGTDTLTNVEILSFNDRSYAVAIPDALVNTETLNSQYASSVASLANGGYVITWTSSNQDGDYDCIYAQRFDSNGNPIGGETSVNTTTLSDQQQPDITGLADGGYLVTWTSYDPDDEQFDIYAQRFDNNGNKLGNETLINTTTEYYQTTPSITALDDGGYIIVWESRNILDDSNDIHAQRYDSSGNKIGNETLVNTETVHDQAEPAIAVLGDGGYVIAWTSEFQDGDGFGIYAQRFDSTGNRIGDETRINTTTAGYQHVAAIAALADGGYVITWTSPDLGEDDIGIYAQQYDSTGDPVGGETLVNTHTVKDQTSPAVAALSDGGYVIAWTSLDQDGDGCGVYSQHFDSSGNKVGAETLVSAVTASDQIGPDITTLQDGSYVITWSSELQDGSSTGIYSQHFNADGTIWQPAIIQLTGTTSADVINGGTGAQILVGLNGSDILNGGAGKDILIGGTGSDIYVLGSGDTIRESVDAGTDLVKTAVTYTLGSNLENLTLTGSAAINGIGNFLTNVITGNVANNILNGKAGNDTLTGGNGKDIFRFDTSLSASTNRDTIKDYSVVHDTIQLDNTIFRKLTTNGTLKAANFKASTSGNAVDKNDFILYETDTGKVYYDADGSGVGSKVLFAVIGTSTHPALTAAEFIVI